MVFDGAKWSEVKTKGPPARRYAAMAYHPNWKGVVLHGGAVDDNGQEKFGDTWFFKDGVWKKLEFPDTSLRDDHGMIFDRKAMKMILLEGVSGKQGLLSLEAKGWETLKVDSLHPQHQCSRLIWNRALQSVMMFGGEIQYGGPQLNKTLVLYLPRLLSAKEFGFSC